MVFDGYDDQINTKSEAQKRRASQKISADILFDRDTTLTCSQDDFLSNGANKSKLISMLSSDLRQSKIQVRQAKGDADTLIVQAALDQDDGESPVFVVATDTDILVLLIAKAREGTEISLVCPSTSKSVGKMYSIRDIQNAIGDAKSSILFAHAITGCDTTSALKGKGKAMPWKIFTDPKDSDKQYSQAAAVFNNTNSTHDEVAAAGESFIKRLYGCSKPDEPLHDLRAKLYNLHIARQPVTSQFDLGVLPPTAAACRQHSYRAYLQVQ